MESEENELNKFIGQTIKKFREAQGWTQDDLATRLDTTRQTVSRYEMGQRKTNQDTLFQLSNLFHKSVNDFFPTVNDPVADQQISDYQEVTDELTYREVALILKYRELPDSNKKSIDDQIDFMLSRQSSQEPLLAAHTESGSTPEEDDEFNSIISSAIKDDDKDDKKE